MRHDLSPDGGVASARELLTRMSRRQLDRALRSGSIRRIRRGWYALPDAHPAAVSAVRAGGRLSCVSLLRAHGVWALDDGCVHVRVAKGATVRRGPAVRTHWTQEPLGPRALDDCEDALRCAVSCLDLRHCVAVVDSVLNTGTLRPEVVESILTATARGRSVLARVEGRAESGIETFARLALRRAGLRVRSQVGIPGVGRVDLVVGDRLVIEVDGRVWHDDEAGFERDRARDRALVALGYVVVRASYRQVMSHMPEITAQVLAVVRRGEHRWRVVHRRARA